MVDLTPNYDRRKRVVQPQLSRTRAAYRAPMSSQKLNLHSEQFRYDLTMLRAKLDKLRIDFESSVESLINGGAQAQTGLLSKYLDSTNQSVTTPDPGLIPNAMTIVAKVQGPTLAGFNRTIVAQYDADPQRSWLLRRSSTSGAGVFNVTPNGLSAGALQRAAPAGTATPLLPGQDEYLAYSLILDNGSSASYATAWRSLDGGKTWDFRGTGATGGVLTPFDSTGPIRIGRYSAGGDIFDGRIYWVEARTGLTPTGGGLLWRFDANDYPGTGTVWTDPRGTTWTASGTGAVLTNYGTQSTVLEAIDVLYAKIQQYENRIKRLESKEGL